MDRWRWFCFKDDSFKRSLFHPSLPYFLNKIYFFLKVIVNILSLLKIKWTLRSIQVDLYIYAADFYIFGGNLSHVNFSLNYWIKFLIVWYSLLHSSFDMFSSKRNWICYCFAFKDQNMGSNFIKDRSKNPHFPYQFFAWDFYKSNN